MHPCRSARHGWPARRAQRGLLAALTTAALAGCSSGPGPGIGETSAIGAFGGGPLPYQASSVIASSGYSESLIGPDRYRIEVKGPLGTPRQRMEKIAATRAAEIGKTNNLGFFKIEGVQLTASCKSYIAGGQRGGIGNQKKQTQVAVLTADVSYAKQPLDASYIQAKPAFEQYRAELDLPQPAGLPADPGASPQCS